MKKHLLFFAIVPAVLGVLLFSDNTSAMSYKLGRGFSNNSGTNASAIGTDFKNWRYTVDSKNYSVNNEYNNLENTYPSCSQYATGGIYPYRLCFIKSATFTSRDFLTKDIVPTDTGFTIEKADYVITITLPSTFYALETNPDYIFNRFRGQNFLADEVNGKLYLNYLSVNKNNNNLEFLTVKNSYCTDEIGGNKCYVEFLARFSQNTDLAFNVNIFSLNANLPANSMSVSYNDYLPFAGAVMGDKLDYTLDLTYGISTEKFDYGTISADEPVSPDTTLGDINNSLNNTDVSGASGAGGGFFNDFTTDTHGLTGIIVAPLETIKKITTSSCTDLVLPLPFVENQNIVLPCMTAIYKQFDPFFTMYQVITFGVISYWVCVRLFNLVKDFKNPDHDEVEVLDL